MARFHFFFFFLIAALALTINPTFSSTESYSESDLESFIFHQDYSPPSPPPPPPHGPSVSCNEDLGGVGFLDSTCEIVADLNLTRDVYISGKGNFIILPGVRFNCAVVELVAASSLRRIRCKHLSFELLEDGGSRQISIVYQIPRWQVIKS